MLHLGTRWRLVASFTPMPLYPQGKNPQYIVNIKLGGSQSLFERHKEEKNLLPLPGI
jgi:hypothetical protein